MQPAPVTAVAMEDTVDSPALIPPLEPGSQAAFGGGWCWMSALPAGWDLLGKMEMDVWAAVSTHGGG